MPRRKRTNLLAPMLVKIRGDERIGLFTPIFDAQFLIGKSWDVSLELNFADIRQKHCTIEKIAADVWTLVSHEDASVRINEHVLGPGYSRYLRCGDFLSLSINIMFQFVCSSLNCDNCNGTTNPSHLVHVPQLPEESPPSTERTGAAISETSTTIGRIPPNETPLPGHNYEQLLGRNARLVECFRNFKNSALHLSREINGARESSLDEANLNAMWTANACQQISDSEDAVEQNKNSCIEMMVDILKCQNNFIDTLHCQVKRFHREMDTVKDRSNNLEGLNQHLNNENVTLRAKIAQYIENANKLRDENLQLQAEAIILRTKHEKLLSESIDLQKKAENSCFAGPSSRSTNEMKRTCEAVMEVKTKLTKLLETEFKCTICEEVFVQAMVTNCGHTFCEQCISTWKVIKATCPICRCELVNESKALAVDSYLTSIMPFASGELKNNWLRVVDERKANTRLQKNSATKRKYFVDPFLTFDFEYAEIALNQFYENLLSSGIDREYREFPTVDLTDD